MGQKSGPVKEPVDDGGPDRLRGFGLRLSPTARTWVLNYSTTGGRERRVVIGHFPACRPSRRAPAPPSYAV